VGAEDASGAAARETLGWVIKNRDDLPIADAALASGP
jgi:hypothetical protein